MFWTSLFSADKMHLPIWRQGRKVTRWLWVFRFVCLFYCHGFDTSTWLPSRTATVEFYRVVLVVKLQILQCLMPSCLCLCYIYLVALTVIWLHYFLLFSCAVVGGMTFTGQALVLILILCWNMSVKGSPDHLFGWWYSWNVDCCLGYRAKS